MSETKVVDSPAALPTDEVGFDVLELLLVLTRRWRLIVGMTIGLALIGLSYSLTLKARYSAVVTFLVDQDTGSGVILYRQTDPTISLLESRAITEFVLDHIDLKAFAADTHSKVTSSDNRLELRSEVKSETTAAKSEQGLYSVKVEDVSPKRAVAIANAYLDALQDLSNRMAFEAASRTRAFYQAQMELQRLSVEKAEVDLKTEQQRTGLLQPSSQTAIELSQIAALRSQIVGLQVQRANVAASSTAESPQMVRLDAEIEELRNRVGALQSRINSSSGQDIPSQNLEVERLQRAVAYHQSLLTSLAGQFERARIQENYGVPRVHTVDRATLPIPQTWPKRFVITVASAAFGLFLGLVMVGLSDLIGRMRQKPASMKKMVEIRRTLRFRRT